MSRKKRKLHNFCRAALITLLLAITAASAPDTAAANMIIPPKKPVRNIVEASQNAHALIPSRKPQTQIQPQPEQNAQNATLLYKKVFELQNAGKMEEADKLLPSISDKNLMGYVLAQRYMHPSYKTNFTELQNWLELYADHIGAERVYKLAQKKKPADFKGELTEPVRAETPPLMKAGEMQPGQTYQSALKRSEVSKTRITNFQKHVIDLVRDKKPEMALSTMQSDKTVLLLDTAEYDRLLAEIAAGFYYGGEIGRAYDLASAAAERSSTYAPLSGWIAGLSAWRQEKYAKAANFFKIPAASKYSSGWLASAGAYWTARAYERAGSLSRYTIWYERARKYERTFYGLAATKALGLEHPFNWSDSNSPQPYKKLIAMEPAGKRALDLYAAGQKDTAEQELMRLQPQTQQDHEAFMAFADEAAMKKLANKIARSPSKPGNIRNDSTLYPVQHWLADNEYAVDPSLIHAIVLQESKFNPRAQSPDGARGLMQLMPGTASIVTKDPSYKTPEGHERLLDPRNNIEIGQRYLRTLLADKNVGGDVVKLLVAYNAGPGNLAKWNDHMKDITDPLLYIESIPSGQTREYVERVISSYWIYKLRSGRDIPSFASLVAGENVIYAGKSG